MEERLGSGKGFTLIEVAIVVVILGILIVLTAPKLETSQTVATLVEAQQGLSLMATGIFAYHDATATDGHFPPAGGVSQTGWSPWHDTFGTPPNFSNNHFHACSVLWVAGSFYDHKGDNSPQDAGSQPAVTTHYDLRVLTSPITALLSIPRDPFKENGELVRSQFDYFGLNLREEFVLRSIGPDGAADVGCEISGFQCACIESECLQLGTGLSNRRVFDGGVDASFECAGCATLDEALRVGNIVYSPTNGVDSRGDLFQISSDGNPSIGSDVAGWQIH